MSLNSDGKLAASMLPTFNSSRQRTTSSTSSLVSSSSNPGFLSSKFSLVIFYLGHLRRRPAVLLCAVATCLLLPLALHKIGSDRITGYVQDLSYPFARQIPPDSPIPEPQPLTELGFEADHVYENIGSTDLDEYRNDLESFLLTSFPSSDSDESNPESLLSILHTFVPSAARAPTIHPQKALQHLIFMPWQWAYSVILRMFLSTSPALPKPARPTIPNNIFQTGPYEGKEPPPEKLMPKTWKNLNTNHTYQYFDNAAAAKYMEARFNESYVNGGKGGGIAHTYDTMKDVPVMQSDFWRYAILATEGGVYCKLVFMEVFVSDVRCNAD